LEHGFGTRHDVGLPPDPCATGRQIHSGIAVCVNSPGLAGECDALITSSPGLALAIKTADCYPVLMTDPRQRVVAAIHAGWRGTAAQIVVQSIRRMQAEFETDPADLRVAVGPGIGGCCYEVGPDVARVFGQDRGQDSACLLDLAAENRRQLIAAGVQDANVDVLGRCTFCEGNAFHSFRRDGERAGRMISYIRVC
jgi:YfiH family protein